MAKAGKAKVDPAAKLVVCRNPKALQRYEIEERIEAGMVLLGSEVKSLRGKGADLDGAYAAFEGQELFLHKMHIAPYLQAGPHYGHEIRRSRKLLLHHRQLERLYGSLTMQGYTLVPLEVYFKNGVAKVELGLGRGKKKADVRHDIRKKQDMAD
ncbi:MAG: SsrA-binding protein SmpB, partial [Polyangiaceae bacterium]|nr:SsrA-binding protein SmpB [Polyangiaceae bacterium]